MNQNKKKSRKKEKIMKMRTIFRKKTHLREINNCHLLIFKKYSNKNLKSFRKVIIIIILKILINIYSIIILIIFSNKLICKNKIIRIERRKLRTTLKIQLCKIKLYY